MSDQEKDSIELNLKSFASSLPGAQSAFDDVVLYTPPPRRPLSSLTEEEAAEVYRLAMGRYGLIAGTLRDSNGGWVDIQSDEFTLYIMSNGHMSVTAELTGEAHAFNAVAVVRYLDGLGIQLG